MSSESELFHIEHGSSHVPPRVKIGLFIIMPFAMRFGGENTGISASGSPHTARQTPILPSYRPYD